MPMETLKVMPRRHLREENPLGALGALDHPEGHVTCGILGGGGKKLGFYGDSYEFKQENMGIL